jgi:predicted methyltransferase
MKLTDKRRRYFSAGHALLFATMVTALLAGCAAPRSAALSSDSIAAIVANPDRSAADRNNDLRRKPEAMLAFIGVRPGMLALDLSAGGGYTTELLARAAGPAGRVYGQNMPRDAVNPPRRPAVPEGDAAPAQPTSVTPPARRSINDRARELTAGHIIPVTRKFEDPVPPEVAPGSLDLATLMFNYHDLETSGVNRAQMNRAVFNALKPGGVYVIADHAGRPGTGISESGTLHRIEGAFLKREVESAGFVLSEEGSFLHNPNDPRDKNTPQPPQPKDEFVMKFVKP